MKRFLFFGALMLAASTWTSTARAQFGMGGFGGRHPDPLTQIKTDRGEIKSRLNTYTHAPTHRGRIMRPQPTNPASMDTYGRMDLSGHPVAGYPVVRGDLHGARVSRGGANGVGRRRPPIARRR